VKYLPIGSTIDNCSITLPYDEAASNESFSSSSLRYCQVTDSHGICNNNAYHIEQ
jgi:hypothetical protein